MIIIIYYNEQLLHQYEKGNVALDVDISKYAPGVCFSHSLQMILKFLTLSPTFPLQFVVTKPANDPNAKVTFNSVASQISGLAREVNLPVSLSLFSFLGIFVLVYLIIFSDNINNNLTTVSLFFLWM